MTLRISILFIFFTFLSINIHAQKDVTLESPELVESKVGEGVVFLVKYNKEDNPQLKLTWKSDILDAKFDDQEGEFYWQTSGEDIGLHSAYFYLKDTAKQIIASSKTLIKIDSRTSVPSIDMEPDSLDSRAFIKLLQGEEYNLEFIASTRNSRNADDVVLTYIWNNDTDLATIDQADTHVVGNRLLLNWTPSQKQAAEKVF
ncbi:hypothetical protein QYS49_36630 [Marivirga salinae]|uniref:Uncharacterized protein n=1 Tax=Marivirga salinarum TaxID=3059078 RepID=A0AA51N8U1_9BACT|nr:hypothetical protein [Marivirga sp. BDSF4-3]WMN10956.1 hypothetical protein QYS49_36630 [Marivirga sp. BDSF4-3]